MTNTNPATNKFQHVIITGASSGIGEALAHLYAAPGVMLGITGRDAGRLDKVAAFCREKGADVSAAVLDVADQKAMESWLQQRDNVKSIDLVIANAGISAGLGDEQFESAAQKQLLVDININGVFNTIDPILPAMVERNHGHIAIMSSLAGFRGWPGAPAYCASKAAVKVYGEGLRGMLAELSVGVSVICPGFVKSRMTAQNDYFMPFLQETDNAARIIQRGIAKNKGRIAFPFPVNFFAWLFGVLPDGLAHILLKKAPAKKALH